MKMGSEMGSYLKKLPILLTVIPKFDIGFCHDTAMANRIRGSFLIEHGTYLVQVSCLFSSEFSEVWSRGCRNRPLPFRSRRTNERILYLLPSLTSSAAFTAKSARLRISRCERDTIFLPPQGPVPPHLIGPLKLRLWLIRDTPWGRLHDVSLSSP